MVKQRIMLVQGVMLPPVVAATAFATAIIDRKGSGFTAYIARKGFFLAREQNDTEAKQKGEQQLFHILYGNNFPRHHCLVCYCTVPDAGGLRRMPKLYCTPALAHSASKPVSALAASRAYSNHRLTDHCRMPACNPAPNFH